MPWELSVLRGPLPTEVSMEGPMEESVQHFYDKLLKLKSLMNTETGRMMAEKRHAFLEMFLEDYLEDGGQL